MRHILKVESRAKHLADGRDQQCVWATIQDHINCEGQHLSVPAATGTAVGTSEENYEKLPALQRSMHK